MAMTKKPSKTKTSKHTSTGKDKPASMKKTSKYARILGNLGGRPNGS